MKCRVCKSSKLTDILSLGNQYLSEFRDDNTKPPQYPLDLVICSECNQVQLKETVPSELLYTDNYGYRSGVNTTMYNHLRDIVFDLVKDIDIKPTDAIIDIGSNDGTLLKWYPKMFKYLYGFDLVSKFASDYQGTGIEFVNKPFTRKNYGGKAKIITCISMFYDADDPITLLQDMAETLGKKGVIIIQQNYLLEMLKNNAFDNIVHEHLCYHILQSMEKIAKPFGLEIFNVKLNDLNGGSFRTYICHKGDYPISAKVKKQLDIELDYELDHIGAYTDFARRVKDIAEGLYKLLIDINREGKSVFVYGASTRGNTLLQYCSIDNKLIQKAVERNPEKYGKKIASVGIPIISEEQARKEHPAYMLVLPWHFFDIEMKIREKGYLNEGGKFIVPLPKVRIVTKDGETYL